MADFNDPCGCNAVLVRDYDSTRFDQTMFLHFLNTITEDTFKELKRSSADSGGFDLFNYFGLNAESSYADFQTARNKFFQEQDFTSAQDLSFEKVRSAVSPQAIQAWQSCKLSCPATLGLLCVPTNVDTESVSVLFRWQPQAGVGEGKVTYSTLLGGRSTDSAVPPGKVFPDGYTVPVNASIARTFLREPGKAFDLSVDVNNGIAGELHLPASPEENAATRVTVNLQYMSLTNSRGFQDYGPANLKIWGSANVSTLQGTQLRTIEGLLPYDGGGASRNGMPVEGPQTSYPINKPISLEIAPTDQLINLTFFLSLEVGFKGGGGAYTTTPFQFTIGLTKIHGQWKTDGTTVSPTLQGYWPNDNSNPQFPRTLRIEGAVQYAVAFF